MLESKFWRILEDVWDSAGWLDGGCGPAGHLPDQWLWWGLQVAHGAGCREAEEEPRSGGGRTTPGLREDHTAPPRAQRSPEQQSHGANRTCLQPLTIQPTPKKPKSLRNKSFMAIMFLVMCFLVQTNANLTAQIVITL